MRSSTNTFKGVSALIQWKVVHCWETCLTLYTRLTKNWSLKFALKYIEGGWWIVWLVEFLFLYCFPGSNKTAVASPHDQFTTYSLFSKFPHMWYQWTSWGVQIITPTVRGKLVTQEKQREPGKPRKKLKTQDKTKKTRENQLNTNENN